MHCWGASKLSFGLRVGVVGVIVGIEQDEIVRGIAAGSIPK